MKNKLSNNVLLMLIGIFVGVLVSTLIYYLSEPMQVFFLGLVITILALYIAIRRLLNYGLSDPIFIFLSFFIVYNGLVLINFAFSIKSDFLQIDLYPTIFSAEVLRYAGLLSFLALLGLIFGIAIYKILFKEKRDMQFKLQMVNFRFLVIIGFIFYLLGLAMFFMTYEQVGGFFTILSISRLKAFQILASAHILPYSGFIFLGIAICFLAVFFYKSKKLFILSIFMLAVWSILLLLQGDRRFFVYSLLIAFVGWSLLFGDRIIKNLGIKKVVLGLFIAICFYIILAFFSQVRFMIPLLINKELSLKESLIWISEHISLDWFMPVRAEFGGPYLSLLYSIKNKSDLLLGSSYAFSIPNILPRSLYPGPKPPGIGGNFDKLIHNKFYSYTDFITGWGYSPVAEAFNNFGTLGVFIVFTMLGLLLEFLGNLRYRSFWLMLVYLMWVPELFNLNRISFASVVQEFVFMVLPVLILYILYMLFRNVKIDTSDSIGREVD
jgi:oligosaccharide repeat unit polymerase